jgi:hypothetical protein
VSRGVRVRVHDRRRIVRMTSQRPPQSTVGCGVAFRCVGACICAGGAAATPARSALSTDVRSPRSPSTSPHSTVANSTAANPTLACHRHRRHHTRAQLRMVRATARAHRAPSCFRRHSVSIASSPRQPLPLNNRRSALQPRYAPSIDRLPAAPQPDLAGRQVRRRIAAAHVVRYGSRELRRTASDDGALHRDARATISSGRLEGASGRATTRSRAERRVALRRIARDDVPRDRGEPRASQAASVASRWPASSATSNVSSRDRLRARRVVDQPPPRGRTHPLASVPSSRFSGMQWQWLVASSVRPYEPAVRADGSLTTIPSVESRASCAAAQQRSPARGPPTLRRRFTRSSTPRGTLAGTGELLRFRPPPLRQHFGVRPSSCELRSSWRRTDVPRQFRV